MVRLLQGEKQPWIPKGSARCEFWSVDAVPEEARYSREGGMGRVLDGLPRGSPVRVITDCCVSGSCVLDVSDVSVASAVVSGSRGVAGDEVCPVSCVCRSAGSERGIQVEVSEHLCRWEVFDIGCLDVRGSWNPAPETVWESGAGG